MLYPSGSMSRAEWIQHLRSEHQRRHRERQGHYPQEDREERYEREIQQDEERVGPFVPSYHQDFAQPTAATSHVCLVYSLNTAVTARDSQHQSLPEKLLRPLVHFTKFMIFSYLNFQEILIGLFSILIA